MVILSRFVVTFRQAKDDQIERLEAMQRAQLEQIKQLQELQAQLLIQQQGVSVSAFYIVLTSEEMIQTTRKLSMSEAAPTLPPTRPRVCRARVCTPVCSCVLQVESIAEEQPPPPPPKSSARLFAAGPQSALQKQLLGDLKSAMGGQKAAPQNKRASTSSFELLNSALQDGSSPPTKYVLVFYARRVEHRAE